MSFLLHTTHHRTLHLFAEPSSLLLGPSSFILKTKEQRLAEKALLDKSPLKTLTLEDFLESERHKLTGTLTPVTPESFARWKKDRLDKKAAEEEARAAKEATGRAMFEQGGWQESDDDDESASDGADDDAEPGWNIDEMRKETERLREEKERERIEQGDAGGGPNAVDGLEDVADDDADDDDDDDDVAVAASTIAMRDQP